MTTTITVVTAIIAEPTVVEVDVMCEEDYLLMNTEDFLLFNTEDKIIITTILG